MRLSAEQERLQKNALIIAARQAVYTATVLKYGKGPTVGEISKVVTKGTTPKTYGFDFVQEGIPFLRAEEVLDGQVIYEGIPFHIDAETNDFMSRSRTRSGDLLMTIAGSIGRVAVVPPSAPELNMNQAVALIRCKDEMNPYFLCHMLQSPEVQRQIFSSTVKTAISNLSLGKIKEILIPFPQLADQEAISEFLESVQKHHSYEGFSKILPGYVQHVPKIVARIEELATRIEEVKKLKKEIVMHIRKTLLSEYTEIVKGAKELPMSEVAPLVRRPVQVDPSKNYYELGIRSFGKGTFHKPPVTGASLGTKRIFKIEAADLLFNIVFAWEGAVAVASREDYGRVGSHRFLTCVPKEGIATSSFLCFHFLTERGLEQLGEASPGSAGRNRTLGMKALEEIKVPIPPLEKQIWFNALQAKFDLVGQLQMETSFELETLLPSILDKAFKGEL